MKETVDKTYTEAVKNGAYDLNVGNLSGKYDNVRSYWEDQVTRFTLRPFLTDLVWKKKQAEGKIRVLDLGCGTGQGFEILTQIEKRDLDLGLQHDRVLPESELECYLGLDLSGAMVAKGSEIYGDKPNVRFMQADLRDGLAKIRGHEPPFDIYFSSYGSLSHLSKADLKSLLRDICEHSQNHSLIVLDLIGRYSIEWPGYWSAKTEEEKVSEYSMSYLYSEFDSDMEIERFPLRFWTVAEVEELAQEISAEAGREIQLLKKFDRSIFVGRHTDTKEYNPKLQPIRRTVNSLHEDYRRTELRKLILDSEMIPSHPEVSPFLNELLKSWNILVRYCQKRLKQNIPLVELDGWSDFSTPLQFALMTLDRVINDTGWMWYGEPRSNIIEPQLGYALRSLEANMQRGIGCGHGLLAILKIRK
ncbi:MAG: class I SAM-dependent methyltransferase [bacterium]